MRWRERYGVHSSGSSGMVEYYGFFRLAVLSVLMPKMVAAPSTCTFGGRELAQAHLEVQDDSRNRETVPMEKNVFDRGGGEGNQEWRDDDEEEEDEKALVKVTSANSRTKGAGVLRSGRSRAVVGGRYEVIIS